MVAGAGIKSIIVNTGYLSMARTLANLCKAVYLIVLAKILGPELYGQFNFSISWYVIFLPLSTLGLGTILIREIGRSQQDGTMLVEHSFSLHLVASLFASVLCFLSGAYIASETAPRLLLLIFSAALFGRSLTVWTGAIFKAYEKSVYELRQVVIFRLSEVAIGLWLLYSGYGILEIAIVHALSWLAQGIVGLRIIYRLLDSFAVRWKLDVAGYLAKNGVPLLASGFLLNWMLQAPLLLYGVLEGNNSDLGQLALALQLLFVVGATINEVGTAALPVLTRSIDRADGKSDFYIGFILRLGFLISGFALIFALTLGPSFIVKIFGPSFSHTNDLLPWSMALIAPFFWINTLASTILAHGLYNRAIITNSIGAIALIVSFPFLVEKFSLIGSLAALALGLISAVTAQLYVLHSRHSISFKSSILRPIFATMASLGVTTYITATSPILALASGISTLVLFASLTGVVNKEELTMLARATPFKKEKTGI